MIYQLWTNEYHFLRIYIYESRPSAEAAPMKLIWNKSRS